MPRKDQTGPDGKGPKRVKQGIPTPKRDGNGTGRGRGTGRGGGTGRGPGGGRNNNR